MQVLKSAVCNFPHVFGSSAVGFFKMRFLNCFWSITCILHGSRWAKNFLTAWARFLLGEVAKDNIRPPEWFKKQGRKIKSVWEIYFPLSLICVHLPGVRKVCGKKQVGRYFRGLSKHPVNCSYLFLIAGAILLYQRSRMESMRQQSARRWRSPRG